jgi:hypothetical protein
MALLLEAFPNLSGVSSLAGRIPRKGDFWRPHIHQWRRCFDLSLLLSGCGREAPRDMAAAIVPTSNFFMMTYLLVEGPIVLATGYLNLPISFTH